MVGLCVSLWFWRRRVLGILWIIACIDWMHWTMLLLSCASRHVLELLEQRLDEDIDEVSAFLSQQCLEQLV